MIKIFNLKVLIKKMSFIFLIIFLSLLFLFYKNDYAIIINENLHISNINFLENNNSINQFILSSELPLSSYNYTISQPILETKDESDLPLAPDNSSTEQLDNSIPISYTNEYNGVFINNSSNYDLTYEILDPSTLSFSKDNIIIFHTHTCESYTQSENSQYEESRKF